MSARAAEMFIGREVELSLLRDALGATRERRGSRVLIVGDAGMGKTSLAEAFAAQARAEGARIAWARCFAGEGAPSYWPWIGLLRACADDSDVGRSLEATAAELRGGASLQARDGGASESRFELFDRVARLLAARASAEPLVLLFDDLHDADVPALRLLQFVARETRECAFLLVATARTPSSLNDPITDTMTELLRVPGTHRIDLGGWSENEVGRYVSSVAGIEVTPETAALLRRRTAGTPFFVAECVRVLTLEGCSDDASIAAALERTLPDSIRAVILRRLASLGPGTRQMLSQAAVLGLEVRVDVLRQASGLPAPAFAAALAEASAGGIFGEASGGTERRRFSHALVRETLEGVLRPQERERLHQRAAAALEDLARGEALGEIAHHWAEAGEPARAAPAARAAGDRALAVFAYEEAERLYREAFSSLERSGAAAGALCEVLLALGAAVNVGGAREEGRQIFRRAAQLAREARATDPAAADLLAHAALGFAGGWTGVGEVARFSPSPASVFDAEAVNLLEEALAASTDTVLRARLEARRAVELHFQLPLAERDRLSREAIELARRGGDAAALAEVLVLRHATVWSPRNAEDRLAVAGGIIEAAQRAGDRALVAAGRGWRVLDLLELGEIAAVRRESALFASLVEEIRQPFLQWTLATQRAMLTLAEGRFTEAEERIREARRVGERGRTWAEMYHSLQMLALRREQGRSASLERFADFLKGAIDQYPTVRSLRTQLAFLLVEVDRLDAARAELEYLARDGFEGVPEDMTWLPALVEAAEACAALRDESIAARLLALLTPYAGRIVLGLGGTVCWGAASRSLGRLATVVGRFDDAEQWFEQALELNRVLGARVWIAHTQHAYGEMLFARDRPGDLARGRYLVEQARVIAESVGMARLTRQLRQLEDGLSAGRPTVSAASVSAPAGAVFRREKDYWTIAFDGTVIRLRDLKGAHYLLPLLQHPWREFHVTELVEQSAGRNVVVTAAARAFAHEASARPDLGDAGERLDRQAAADYRARLETLREELAEAEARNDIGRAANLRNETEFLVRELAGSLRSRKSNSHAERARLTVTKAIKKLLARIRDGHPALAQHLEATVRRGYFCSYTPDPRSPMRWET